MTVTPRAVVVAVNPMASFGHRRDVGPRVVECLRAAGHRVVAMDEANIELLRRETAKALQEGADALVVVGGDGMANLGIDLVAETGTPLGIVPSGAAPHYDASVGDVYGQSFGSVQITASSAGDLIDRFITATYTGIQNEHFTPRPS